MASALSTCRSCTPKRGRLGIRRNLSRSPARGAGRPHSHRVRPRCRGDRARWTRVLASGSSPQTMRRQWLRSPLLSRRSGGGGLDRTAVFGEPIGHDPHRAAQRLHLRLSRHLQPDRHGRGRAHRQGRGSDALPFTDGVICNKVAQDMTAFVHGPDRLLHPLAPHRRQGSRRIRAHHVARGARRNPRSRRRR